MQINCMISSGQLNGPERVFNTSEIKNSLVPLTGFKVDVHYLSHTVHNLGNVTTRHIRNKNSNYATCNKCNGKNRL